MEEPSHRTESEAGGDDQQQLRRPMNAFLLFCKRHRRMVKSQHPWLDNRSCTKMLADMWAVLDGEEKSKYLQLARECKAAFMKAHPGYKWCGSSKQNMKHMSPTVTTRTKLPITPPFDSTPEERLSMREEKSSGSRVGITPGKLADPSDMGGLSLLLLAGQQAMDNKCPTTPPQSEAEPPEDAIDTEDLLADTKSRLFEFAEMCTSQQIMESSTCSKPSTLTTPPATPILPEDGSEESNPKSPLIKDLKNKPPSFLDFADDNKPTHKELDGRLASKEKKGHKKGKKRNKGEKKKKKSSHRGMCESKTNYIKEKVEGIDTNRVMVVKQEVKDEVRSKVKDEVGSKVEGQVKLEVRGEEDKDDHDGNKNSSASYDDKEEEEEEEEDDDELPGGRRKSSRSCKGRLYRQMVMGGMLESLQRPERPFNCKKPWRHGDSTCYSDGDDAVFEPEPEKPKRPSRRKARKRTLSGCGMSLPVDFDYGEIDVEARLATLPQYSPDQFQPKGKHCYRAKRSSSLYKNSTFIKKEGREYQRSISNPEGGRSAPTSPTQHSSLTGSQKRKARKSSIMHLTPSHPDEKTNSIANGDKCNSLNLMPDTYSQQTKSTRVRLEFKPSLYGDQNSNNNEEPKVSCNSIGYSSSSSTSASQHPSGCGNVMLATREPRSASQKPCSSSRSTNSPASLNIGMPPTLTVS